MRITDVNTSQKTGQVKKKNKTGKSSSGSVFSIDAAENSSGGEAIQETQNLVNIQSVLSIDSIGLLSQASNEDYVKQQNISWGHDTIKHLEAIKYQILNGKVSYSSLLSLKERLNNIPINPADIKLRNIMMDIETRAAVEFEKLKRQTESAKLFINEDEVENG